MAELEDKLGKGNKLRKSLDFIRWLLVKLFQFIKWLLWDFSGLRFVWEKIRPPDSSLKVRPPATFLIWVIAIYVAFFGVASQRYENRVDVIENRRNAVLTLLVKDQTRKSAIRNVPIVQRMLCPRKPDILDPILTFKSLFGERQAHEDTVDFLKGVIVDFKSELSEAHLTDANLQGAGLDGANLKGAELLGANLEYAHLEEANLRRAHLQVANLQDAELLGANLKDAKLSGANLQGVSLASAKNLTAEQLCKVHTLYKAIIESQLKELIEKKCPDLRTEPRTQLPAPPTLKMQAR